MKKYHVEITAATEAELREAYLWIREDSPERATRWRKGLLKQIERLETLPERCPLAPENQFFAEEIRQLLYGRRGGVYRILFTSEKDTVYVLHIRHGARQVLRKEEQS